MINIRSNRQSPEEEKANALLHLLGFAFSLIAVVVLVILAATMGTARHIVSCSIYGGTLIILYLSSTLYHVIPPGRTKALFRYIDHGSILLLIAGTYTPFMLITLRGGWGWSIFGAIWGLAILGILMKIFIKKSYPMISTFFYLLMGWLVLIAIKPLIAALAPAGMMWLAVGGIFYTGGVIFFVLDTIPYFHAVWHIFVLAGSACQYYAVLTTVLPG